jgi:phage terminase large subunit-like protein
LGEHEQKELYKKWHFEKQIILTSGNAVDYDYILADILKINKICPIYAVFYDTYNATQFAINATEQGLNMQPFSQSLANFNRPTKEFERLARSNKIIIDNNEITRFCFSNVVLKYDHNDNVKPTKSSNKNKIDGVISMLTALGGYLQIPKYDTSIYTF